MKNINIIFLLLSLTLFSSLEINSQNITILDSETHLPVSNVMVFDEYESTTTVSNASGSIDLSLFEKNSKLWIKHPAYNLLLLQVHERNQKIIYLIPKIFTIDEFIVSANRIEENKKNIPYFIQTVAPKTIQYKNANTAADILTSTGYVAVQKSQGGGGSPVLRGFEANRILLVVDGVRMNNAIYRSGHLQNSITIDPSILNNTEILFGPSSVMYGSDALGGVISYNTKNPVYSTANNPFIKAGAALQAHSSTNTLKSNIHLNLGSKKIASLTSFSYSDFGDIEMGKNRRNSAGADEWGKMLHYSKRINGKDSMFINPNPSTQLFTGYKQYDIIQKMSFQTNRNHELMLNSQYSTSSNIHRFDALNDYKNDYLKYSEYYYGPQERLFVSANSQYNKQCKIFSSVHTVVAYQKIKESRHSRKFNSEQKLSQVEDLNIGSINIDLVKQLESSSRINYGIEFIYNHVNSNASYKNINTNNISSAPTRYPNGGTHSHTYAIYTSYHTELNPNLIFNAGIRIGHYHFSSKFKDTDGFKPLLKKLDNRNTAPSGSIGFVYSPDKSWKINTIFTSGYRVANVDDYGKIRAKNDEISLPNPGLKPEYAYNLELSADKSFNNEMILLNISLYHTWLRDAIVRSYNTPYKMDSIPYDGDLYRIVTNINAQKASIKGICAGVNASPLPHISIQATINYTHGKITSTNEPLGHITPLFGKISTSYQKKRYKTEVYIHYQGKKEFADMSPYGEDNEEEGINNTFPSWCTINWANQFEISENIIAQISIENITDIHYKTFSSGISSPGRNFIISISSRF